MSRPAWWTWRDEVECWARAAVTVLVIYAAVALAVIGALALLGWPTSARCIERDSGVTHPAMLACPFGATAQCDDRRMVTTSRASPVPCLRDGVWGTAGVDEACVSDGGLDCYGAVLNYATNSTDGSKWGASGATVTPNADGSWRVTDDNPAVVEFITDGGTPVVAGDVWTITVEARRGPSGIGAIRITSMPTAFGGVPCTVAISDEWERYSCTSTATSGGDGFGAYVDLSPGGNPSIVGDVDIRQLQLTKSSTPGRRCDAGASPLTCEGDVHEVSTAGWPVASGEVSLTYDPANATTGATRRLLDGRDATTLTAPVLFLNAADSLLVFGNGAEATIATGLSWDAPPYVIQFRWSGTTYAAFRNGTLVGRGTWGGFSAWGEAVTIGARFTGIEQANGTISHLEVRQ